MTKAEIVAEIAQKTGIEKVAIQATVEEFMTVIKESLSEGENPGSQHPRFQARQDFHAGCQEESEISKNL